MTPSEVGGAAASGGPLTGLRVVEIFAYGPVAHAGTLLSDLGADVVLVARPGWLEEQGGESERTWRGRTLVEADLKDPAQRDAVLDLITRADVVLEGFRPGVAERLGLGPERCSRLNPRLVYGRMTGWGQTGPRAHQAGHDINYLALTGHLRAIAREGGRPVPPLNLVGDYGGGSMFLVTGVLAALLERQRSGRGQVVDAAMVDGASMLGHVIWAMRERGTWHDEGGTNVLDTGAPYYDVYATADGEYMAVGAIEPQFFAELVEGLGLDPATLPAQHDHSRREELREAIAEAFRSRTRAEWTAEFAHRDACVTPVLSYAEVAADPHVASRSTVVDLDGAPEPAPAPRFSRTPSGPIAAPPRRLSAVADVWRGPGEKGDLPCRSRDRDPEPPPSARTTAGGSH